MNRKHFLNLLGLSTAAVLFIDTLSGCQKNNFAPQNVDFTFNTTDPLYSALKNPGGFVYINDVIVARTSSGSLIALSKICTHQGCTVQYQSSQNNFNCPCHGSVFNSNGTVLRGPAGSLLMQYTVDISGNSVHVYSA